ncbi:uncharacterized protein LOC135467587 [Liolophura sinensis]|uniref:uncharacterized protein LOC135467587 n=1 Tax=Liolophura sinensis TaxID=3198878 RepID=UPI0031594C2F
MDHGVGKYHSQYSVVIPSSCGHHCGYKIESVSVWKKDLMLLNAARAFKPTGTVIIDVFDYREGCVHSCDKLALYVDSRYLTGADLQFVELVTNDIHTFLEGEEKASLNRILLFPPVDSYHRLLIHKTAEQITGLNSFSVGEGKSRRTVVCHKLTLLRDTCFEQSVWNSAGRFHKINTVESAPVTRSQSSADCYHDSADSENTADQPTSRQTLTHNCSNSPHTSETQTPSRKRPSAMESRGRGVNSKSRQRTKRPEMQIYVPRGRRLQQRNEGVSVTTATDNTPPTLPTSSSTVKTSSNSETKKSMGSSCLLCERDCDGDKPERRSLSPHVGRGRAKTLQTFVHAQTSPS